MIKAGSEQRRWKPESILFTAAQPGDGEGGGKGTREEKQGNTKTVVGISHGEAEDKLQHLLQFQEKAAVVLIRSPCFSYPAPRKRGGKEGMGGEGETQSEGTRSWGCARLLRDTFGHPLAVRPLPPHPGREEVSDQGKQNNGDTIPPPAKVGPGPALSPQEPS